MNAHETPMLRAFKLWTLQMNLQLDHNFVITMNSNHPIIGETKDPLSSFELRFMPKHYFYYIILI